MTDDRNSTRDRWRTIDRLFDAALDQPPASRVEFLDEACGDDHALRDAVIDLLRADEASEGRFESPGPSASRECIEDLVGRTPPDRRLGP